MKLTILLLLALCGCAAARKHFTPLFPSDSYIACQQYGYCGDYAYVARIGSEVCYGPDWRIAEVGNKFQTKRLLQDPQLRCQ